MTSTAVPVSRAPGQFQYAADNTCQYYLSCETMLVNFTYTIVNGTLLETDTTLFTNPLLINNLIGPNAGGISGAHLIDTGLIAIQQNDS